MHFSGTQLTLLCLQLSHTFHALKDLFFSTELTRSYKCKPQEFNSCRSTLVQCSILRQYVLLNIIFYRILNLEPEKLLQIISLKLQ